MYSRNRKKSKNGRVQIRNSNNRLQLVFTFEGKRHFISTGLGDTPYNRKQAQDKALEIERDIAYGQFNPHDLHKYKVNDVLAIDATVEPDSVSIPDLPELWKRYIEARSSGKSPATVRMYGWVTNHLERCPHKLLHQAQAIFDWLNSNVPANSTKRILMHLSACCKWAKKSGLLDLNPFEGSASEVKIKKRGTEDHEIKPFSRYERDCVMEAFKNNRYYRHYAPLVEFLFFTGCRPSEAIALQWKHIDSNFITFKQTAIYDGKGIVIKSGLKTQQSRKFPINAQLSSLLESIKPSNLLSDSLVFPSKNGTFIDWHNFTSRAWKTILNSLPDIEYRNPYQTRHTFCSLCREANISSIQLAKWVGNSAQIIDLVYAKPVEYIPVPEL